MKKRRVTFSKKDRPSYDYRRTGVTRLPVKGSTPLSFSSQEYSRMNSSWFERLVHIMHTSDTFDRTGVTIALVPSGDPEIDTKMYGNISGLLSSFYNEGYIEPVLLPNGETDKCLAHIYTEQEVKRLPNLRGIRLTMGKDDWKIPGRFRKTQKWSKFVTKFRAYKTGSVGLGGRTRTAPLP